MIVRFLQIRLLWWNNVSNFVNVVMEWTDVWTRCSRVSTKNCAHCVRARRFLAELSTRRWNKFDYFAVLNINWIAIWLTSRKRVRSMQQLLD